MRAGALLRFMILPAGRMELTPQDRDGMLALGLVVLMGRRCWLRVAARRASRLRELAALVFVTRRELTERLLRFREQVDELVGLGVEGRFMRVHAEKVGPAFINFRQSDLSVHLHPTDGANIARGLHGELGV